MICRSERYAVTALFFSVLTFMGAEPFLARLSAGRSEIFTRLYLYMSATLYGVPLIIAAVFMLFSARRTSFFGSALLDALLGMMSVYWFASFVHGLLGGNDPRFVISDGFNFFVPMLTYYVARRITSPGARELLLRRLRTAIFITLPLQLVYTFWLVVFVGFTSGGVPFFLLYCTWMLHEVMTRPGLRKVLWYAMACLSVIVSLKRALLVALFIHAPLYVFMTRRWQFLFRLIFFAAVIVSSVWFVGVRYLPEAVSLDQVQSRLESLSKETGGFQHLQARQDEIVGILASLRAYAPPTGMIFGRGMGATYTVVLGVTSGARETPTERDYHNSHFSPFGWMLREGLIGMAFYASFYILGALLMVRATWREKRLEIRSAYAAATAFYVLSLVMCLSSFSLPASPLVVVTLALVINSQSARTAPSSRAAPRVRQPVMISAVDGRPLAGGQIASGSASGMIRPT